MVGERLGHEGRVHTLLDRHFLHHQPERHDVVGGGQRVRVAQVDLLLPGRALVVAVLHRDAHGLQHRDRGAPEVVCDAVRRVIVVAAGVDRPRPGAWFRPFPEQEELDLGVRVEGEAELRGPGQVALEHPARVRVRRRPVGQQDVAEHPGDSGVLPAPRQQLERGRVRAQDHVRLVDPGEAFDRGTVEADPVGERALQLGGGDRHRLQRAEHVGEPEPDEPDVPLLQRAQHELFLPVHGYHLRRSSLTDRPGCESARLVFPPCYRRPAPAPRTGLELVEASDVPRVTPEGLRCYLDVNAKARS